MVDLLLVIQNTSSSQAKLQLRGLIALSLKLIKKHPVGKANLVHLAAKQRFTCHYISFILCSHAYYKVNYVHVTSAKKINSV